jgi:Zn finger protein HypA/HybF involved in hydrogenase expression
VRDAKEGLYITDEGKSYIESIKELDIVSPVFAAKMDTSIKQIQRGEVPFENAQEEVLKKLYEMIEQVNSMQGGVASQKSMPEFNTNINCPICEKTLRAGAYKYECECGFSIARTILGHELIVEQLEQLCNERKSGPYVFTNKSGKNFVAYLILGEDNKAQFEFLKERTATCPICQKELNINGIGAFCKDCGLKIFRNQRGHALSEEELNGILRGEKITCHDFKQKNGTTYSGMIYLKNGNISLIYGVNEQIKKE